MTGLQLAEAIGKERPGIPVILAAGCAGLPSGMQIDYLKLNKPFTEFQLSKILDAVEEKNDMTR